MPPELPAVEAAQQAAALFSGADPGWCRDPEWQGISHTGNRVGPHPVLTKLFLRGIYDLEVQTGE